MCDPIFPHFIITDSINTKKTLEHLRDLISQCNIYVSEVKSQHQPNRILLQNIGDYIIQMFKVSLNSFIFLKSVLVSTKV